MQVFGLFFFVYFFYGKGFQGSGKRALARLCHRRVQLSTIPTTPTSSTDLLRARFYAPYANKLTGTV